jgi:hypothetical protein
MENVEPAGEVAGVDIADMLGGAGRKMEGERKKGAKRGRVEIEKKTEEAKANG